MTLRRHRGAIVAAVLALLCGLLTGCGSSSPDRRAPTTAQIRATLARHGPAVTGDERATFLSGVSDTPASAGYRSRQSAVFSNLVQLPLGRWSYTLGPRSDSSSAEAAATKEYGSDAVIYRVTLTYSLTAFDPVPTTHELYLSFVRDGNRAVIAGDSDLASAGGASWRGPWDFGPLVIGRGVSALVIAHASAGNLSTVVQEVDSAVPAVTAVWGQDWVKRVVVLIPSDGEELEADAGLSSELTTDTAASTVSDGTDALTRAAFGLRLVVNPPALAKLSALGRRITLRHEITHIAAGAVTSDSSPRWLVEGFAEYVGELDTGQSVRTAASELAAVVRAGTVPAALPGETTFDTDATAAQAYEESWLACRLIASQVGQSGLVRFYRAVGASMDSENAVQQAMASVLHTTPAEFTTRWRAYLRAQLG